MARIVLTAKVEDTAKWEAAFRTHGSLFREMTSSVTHYTMTDANEVAVYSEPTDLARWQEVLASEATAEAMALDGVVRESVKVFVLDREFRY